VEQSHKEDKGEVALRIALILIFTALSEMGTFFSQVPLETLKKNIDSKQRSICTICLFIFKLYVYLFIEL
jgi:hypothetical protein